MQIIIHVPFENRYEGADGSYREERGRVIDPEMENSPLEVEGSYRYLDADQKVIEVHYTANQHGFVPEGEKIDPSITKNAKALHDMMMMTHPK